MEALLAATQKYVINHLNDHLDKTLVYHNLAHTLRVVEKTKELIEAAALEDEAAAELVLAAWFHDTGFTDKIDGHEEKSAEFAAVFLEQQKAPKKLIEKVTSLILATRMDHEPKTELQKIIRDADCSHIGSKGFVEQTELLRKEWELTLDKKLSETQWLDENIDFLTNKHRFYSDVASENWDKQKAKNLAQLLKAQKKLKQENSKLKQKKEELAFKKSKIELPERGIETMFRVALRNHITLSDIADTKANILLSVNAIIISLVLSNLISKLDNPSNQYLIIPTLIFTLFTVISMVMSIMATRPNVTKGKFSKEDVNNKKVNLLFFGNFHQMKLDDFEWAMEEMMKDRDYLYSSLTKDLYFLGLVLNRKYNLLRHTYSVFMVGIVVSVVSFAVAFYLQSV